MADTDFFARMALDLHAAPDTERTIERIAEYARAAVTCDGAGIMRTHSRARIETAAATTPAVAEANHLQMLLDEGPCLDALDDDQPYVTRDAGTDARYPAWGPAVAELGYASVLNVVLSTTQRRYGSLTLYASRPDAFDSTDLAIADIFSRHAAVAIAAAHEQDGLQIAVDARKLVGQAQGILMERFDLDADRAFEFLRRHSQDYNVKLRVVAGWVVQNRRSHRMPHVPRTAPVPNGRPPSSDPREPD